MLGQAFQIALDGIGDIGLRFSPGFSLGKMQPGSVGQLATKTPSSSCSIITLNFIWNLGQDLDDVVASFTVK